MSVRAQNLLLAVFVLALIVYSIALTATRRGPLIDRSERPMPTVPEWTPQTVGPAVIYQPEEG